jgi:hypothetical protein
MSEMAELDDHVVLYHSMTRRTGQNRVHPLFSTFIEGKRAAVAAEAGAPNHPQRSAIFRPTMRRGSRSAWTAA